MQQNFRSIYSPRINGIELLRTLALKGVNTFNVRIYNLNDLLDDINACSGFSLKEEVLSKEEIEEKILKFFLDKIDLSNPTYQDVSHFSATLSKIRSFITESNELEVFDKIVKNNKDNKSLLLLNDFFKNYMESLGNKCDQTKYIHKIIDNVLNNKGITKIYHCIEYFKEDNISPLEIKLLKEISFEVKEISVIDLFEINSNPEKIKDINPRYGTRNEVAHVIKDIIHEKHPLDEYQIVLINKPGYLNELYKFMTYLNAKMTFECGLPINLTDPYKLYATLLKIGKKNFYDVNGYLSLFSCESFDLNKFNITYPAQVAQLLGRMKICLDKSKNDEYISKFNNIRDNHKEEFELILEKIDRTIVFSQDAVLGELYHAVEELSKGIAYIVKEYSKCNIANEDLHNEAIEYIVSTLEHANSEAIPDVFKESYLTNISNKYIGHQLFKDDAIHVVTIDQALSSLRRYTYFIGLNSAFYPGSLTEDFLFSDAMYEELTGIKEITEASLNKKNEYLKTVIDTNLSLGNEVKLSYNVQEIKEVRELNPCSVLLDYAESILSKDEFKDRIKKCSYYDDELSELCKVANIAVNNNIVAHKDYNVVQQKSNGLDTNGKKLVDKSYSPSTLPKFLKCPLRFYLDNIVGADDTIIYDPLRPMSGNRFGDLLHFVMEQFVNKKTGSSLDDVLKYASNLFDYYIDIDRSISDDSLEKKPFLRSVENAYNFLTTNFDLTQSKTELNVGYGKEETKTEIGGIHFRGSIDLVTQDKDGNYIVLDYKTGSHIEHIDNDPETCIQGLIYAQLFEKLYGKTVSKLVFYYTRFDACVIFDEPCSDESKALLIEKVTIFKEALEKLEFNIAEEKDFDEVCKYCKYENICKKDEGKEEESSDGE